MSEIHGFICNLLPDVSSNYDDQEVRISLIRLVYILGKITLKRFLNVNIKRIMLIFIPNRFPH